MALDATRLSASIKAAILANPAINGLDNAAMQGLCVAIATAVVTEITTNAVIPALGLVAPGGGGPVTGAAVIT